MNRVQQNTMKFMALLCLLFSLYMSLNAQCERKLMVEDYEQYFLGTQVLNSNLGWDGDVNQCIAGNISADARKKTLERINYFRQLVHLPTSIGMDDDLTNMCQKAALMMHSNNQLSHDPDENWSCFSSEGKTAASKSNLALGAHSTEAINLFMFDPGENNTAVGHRRWILYSRAKDFGMGSTNRAFALYVIHNKIPKPDGLGFVAYPSAGYFPAPLLPDRWSISYPGADFSRSSVAVQDESGEQVDLVILPLKNGFGDNTLVWEITPGAIDKFASFDQTFSVTVQNVQVGAQDTSFTYETVIAPPTYPPLCKDGYTWNDSSCNCENQELITAVGELNNSTFQIFPNPASNFARVNLPDAWELGNTIFTLTDLSGRRVMDLDCKTGAILDLERVPEGFYTAIAQHGYERKYVKFIVKH
ncbi:MAG: hypothetical protein KDC53_05090 [Saprospiraceae bacterium]|nr:hypothetical protein [Saprospiraceae bacterium]